MTETSEPRHTFSRARWAVPAVIAVAVAGAYVAPPLLASAGSSGLPGISPEQLVTAVANASPTPLSGTVVYTSHLGLPELPLGEAGVADPIALLSGSSTMRVWTDGTERSRVALLGEVSEYSVVRDGSQAWTYSSSTNAVVHYALSPKDAERYAQLGADAREHRAPAVAGDLPTPDAAARGALAQVSAFSTVSLDSETTIAGRAADQLVVTPTSTTTLVARIVVAVDAATSTPLRVQVWSTQDAATPALQIGFTDVTFATPDAAVLAFSQPAGAKAKDVVVALPEQSSTPAVAPLDGTLPKGAQITGTGWDTIVQLSGVDVAGLIAGNPSALTTVPGAGPTIGSQSAQDLIQQFAPSDGSTHAPGLDKSALYNQLTTVVPEGRMLTSTLLSILVTNDGRVLIGSVPPETLRAMA